LRPANGTVNPRSNWRALAFLVYFFTFTTATLLGVLWIGETFGLNGQKAPRHRRNVHCRPDVKPQRPRFS
jgi:hypothetical protein